MKTFADEKTRMEQAAKSLKNLDCSYVNIPFVVDGVATNMARWNVAEQKFDMLIVPIYTDDGEESINVEIEI